jgi:hypothetical protein
MKSLPIEKWFSSLSIDKFFSFIQLPFIKYLLIGSVFLITSYFGTIRYLEYTIFESRIQVNDIRNFITQVINKDLSKAVDLGIIEFSIWEGILIEDLMISQEEDFTYNRKLLQSKKIGLKLSSLFSKNPYIKKIKIINPKIQIDTGDDFFSSLVDYLLRANIQEVEFSGLQIDVFESENQILNIKQRTDWLFYKSEDRIEFRYSNGWFWLPFVTRIQGNGSILLKDGKPSSIEMNTRLKNLDTNEVKGLASWIHLFDANEGITSGTFSFQQSEFQQVFQSDAEWNNMKGNFIFWDKANWEDVSFKNSFKYQKDLTTKIISTDRNYLNEWGEWNYSVINENELDSSKLKWNFLEMAELKSSLPSWKNILIQGSFKGNFEWKESGTRNNWFLVNGKSTWEKGLWKDRQFDISWDKWEINIQENQMESIFKGQLFSSNLNLTSKVKLQFWKSFRPNKTTYYPVGMTGNIDTKLETLQLDDWLNLKISLNKYIQNEIKERQEKMIPEEYFTQQKIYKYLLEDMNLVWNGNIKKILIQEQGSESLDWNHSISIQSGRISAKANQQNSKNSLSFSSQFATKSPYMEFNINLDDFEWKKPIFQLCGKDIIPDKIDLDYRFRSSGSDFNSITKQGNHSSTWNLKNNKIYEDNKNSETTNNTDRFPLPGWSNSEEFDLSFEMDHYFENSYYRSISIISKSGKEWKGFGNTKNNLPNYTLYGKVDNEYKTIQLVEEADTCK